MTALEFLDSVRVPTVGNPLWSVSMQKLFAEFFEIARECRQRHRATNAPFEIFWHNPSEPEHSHLIAHFLDYRIGDSRPFLESFLRRLCGLAAIGGYSKVAELQTISVDTNCTVDCEKRGAHGQIDLEISCLKAGAEFSIIIENKINGAVDQENQLPRYVDARSRFKSVHVVYLPLYRRMPPVNENGKLEVIGATFGDLILPWLEEMMRSSAALAEPDQQTELLAHVRYYSMLINHLLARDIVMDQMIDEKLKCMGTTIPPWREVETLHLAATRFKEVYEHRLRYDFMHNVENHFRKERLEPIWLQMNGDREEKITEPCKEMWRWQSIALPIWDDTARVCVTTGWDRATGLLAEVGCRQSGKRLEENIKSHFDQIIRDATTAPSSRTWLPRPSWWYGWYGEPMNLDKLSSENYSDAKRFADLAISLYRILVANR